MDCLRKNTVFAVMLYTCVVFPAAPTGLKSELLFLSAGVPLHSTACLFIPSPLRGSDATHSPVGTVEE